MERSNTNKLISVVIPVKNGIRTLPECLEGIRKQTLYDQCEIIIIDSGSTDGTVEYLRKQKDVLLKEIPPETFNHGLTRSLGVSLAKGDFIVMTVQDATPVDGHWLEKLIRHFDDPEVAGVCGQQVVPHHSDTNPHQWFRPVNPPKVQKVKFEFQEAYDRLSPEKKREACGWDNVNAIYHRDSLLRIPFRESFFAEDAQWAQDALRAGLTLVYDTSARVYHYHYQTFEYTYKRVLTQLYFAYKLFGYRQDNDFKSSDYLKIFYRNFRYNAHPKWLWHNFRLVSAKNKAFKDFYHWLIQGDACLDQHYQLACKTPPQGKTAR